jgi:DNA-binding transcriptional MerR regulator
MLHISALARRFGLARSTLLHYDHLGLLRPSVRSRAGYRRYSDADAERLGWICTYRRAGLSLEAIGRVLAAPAAGAAAALERRLVELDQEMGRLREQQRVIAALLERPLPERGTLPMDKTTWTELLRASGLSDQDMDRWHQTFEREAPDQHQQFLAALGIPEAEVAAIRARYAEK